MVRVFLVSVFLLLSTSNFLIAQTNFHKGKIIDSIKVSENSNETFSLYLPTSFQPNGLSPIVFIYEPAARGTVGIAPFIKASEKYGHILVCSNDSRNGSIEKNFQIANRLFEKVFSEYNINPKLMYLAGFSGGARLASSIALETNQFAGVIACGAGFSNYLSLNKSPSNFSYAMIVGDEDMNYLELMNTKNYLSKLQVLNELFVYEMGHKWPSQDQILEVFDWLELKAINGKIKNGNNDLLSSVYNKYYKKAKKKINSKKLLYANDEYLRIQRNFKDYYLVDSISKLSKKLLKNKTFKKEKLALANSFEEESLLTQQFANRFLKDIQIKSPNIKWWNSEIDKIKKKQVKSISYKNKMYSRVLNKLFAMAFEKTTIDSSLLTINQSIFCFDICIAIYPEYALPYIKQAENYLSKNEPNLAIDYLENLLNTGYTNKEKIIRNGSFQILKTNERFKKLMSI